MHLIFVHYLGKNHNRQHTYEFIYTEHLKQDDITDDSWDASPCSGNVESPLEWNDHVDIINLSFELELIQDNDFFDMSHCKRKIIPLAWTDSIETTDVLLEFFEDRTSVLKKINVNFK